MNWDDLRHFSALASAGSLSGAARMLGVEHATVARRISSLENHLGVQLVDRRGRRWSLTGEGERIAAIAERMETEAQAVRRAADGARSELSGTVTISAPPALALAFLTQPLVALQARHQALTIRMLSEARTASLDRSEADIAVRLSRPEDGDLMITRLGRLAFRLYANPDYLALTKEAAWRFIGYEGASPRAPQQTAAERFAGSRPFTFFASSLEIQQAAARAGGGVAALPDFMARSDPGLVAAVPEELMSRDIWFVVHNDLRRSAPVRAILEKLREAFASHPRSPDRD
ncbi:LysR family transcriptional regulator [Rhodobacterales bacterium]|nr:LysR family transcriptional regulator [Rhodobacterales bacterium]